MTRKKNELVGAKSAVDTTRDARRSGWSYRPRIDVVENANEFTIHADLPGAAASDVDVTYTDGVLKIHGLVPLRQDRDMDFLTHEYGVGDFDREIVFADAIDADAIHAVFHAGVLTVHLPKPESAKPRSIPVRPA